MVDTGTTLVEAVLPSPEAKADEEEATESVLLSFEMKVDIPSGPSRSSCRPSAKPSNSTLCKGRGDRLHRRPAQFCAARSQWGSRRIQRGGFDGAPGLDRGCLNAMWCVLGVLVLGAAGGCSSASHTCRDSTVRHRPSRRLTPQARRPSHHRRRGCLYPMARVATTITSSLPSPCRARRCLPRIRRPPPHPPNLAPRPPPTHPPPQARRPRVRHPFRRPAHHSRPARRPSRRRRTARRWGGDHDVYHDNHPPPRFRPRSPPSLRTRCATTRR